MRAKKGGCTMGEVIFSIFVGGWMVVAGIFLIKWLSREEKTVRKAEITEGGNES
jgi:hypothetical protein